MPVRQRYACKGLTPVMTTYSRKSNLWLANRYGLKYSCTTTCTHTHVATFWSCYMLSRPVAVKQLPGPSLPKTDGTV